ncbi:MAG: PIN domain-containing protein [Anaerolineales bacterium]
MIYIDTSALLAVLDQEDINHSTAKKTWLGFLETDELLLTNSYVMVESIAIIQNRLGLKNVRRMTSELLPVIEIDWLDPAQHEIALNDVLTANRRNLSLVDCASFETMRRLRIETVFTFDDHFKEQDFTVIP